MSDTKPESGTTAWNPNDVPSRPLGSWQYYRDGIIVPITEDEARHNFDRWCFLSDDRGAACFMLAQLWDEIDKLRRAAREAVSGKQ